MVLRCPVDLTVAGRTDAGVHATGQVAHCDVPRELWEEQGTRLVRRLRGVLPPDISVSAVTEAPTGFDARFGGPGPALRLPADRRRVRPAAAAPGGHRRLAAQPGRRGDDAGRRAPARASTTSPPSAAAGRAPRRSAPCSRSTSSATATSSPIAASADAFCHSMVRSLVGALSAVGEGRRPVEWPAGLLRPHRALQRGPGGPGGRADPGARSTTRRTTSSPPERWSPAPGGAESAAGAATASATGVVPLTTSSTAPGTGRVEQGEHHGGDVVPGDRAARPTCRARVTRPVPGSSVSRPGPQHGQVDRRPLARALLGGQLRLQVGVEDVVEALGQRRPSATVSTPIDDIIRYWRTRDLSGGVGEQDGGGAVHRVLAAGRRCPARRPRRRPRRRCRRRSTATSSTVARLEVEDDGLDAVGDEVRLVVGVAHDADDGVAPGR